MRWTIRSARRLAALGAGLLLLSTPACRTDRDIQRDFARERLEPTPLAPASVPDSAPQVRSYPVRAWVADGYGAGVLGARHRIEAQVARANLLLEPQFGVRLELVDVRPWRLTGEATDLEGALRALVAMDAGPGAGWVIGFVPAHIAVVPGSLDPLGRARLLGKHLVVRDMVNGDERRGIEAVLRALPEAERERVLTDRRLHRETAVLVHEWAHTLGAFHDRAGDSIMNPQYHSTVYRLTDTQVRICKLGLQGRDGPAPARVAWAREYRDELERSRDEAWDPSTIEGALSAVQQLDGGGPPEPSPSPSVPPAAARPPPAPAPRETAAVKPQPGKDARQHGLATAVVQADLSDRRGDAAAGWRRVAPLAASLAEIPYARRWLCHLQRRARAVGEDAAACARLPELAPPMAAMLVAHVLAELHDDAGAGAAARRAEQALQAQKRAAPRAAWAELADLLAGVGACTAAERVAARAPEEELARSAVTTCVHVRAQTLLPRGAGGVDADREPEYVRAVLSGRAALDSGDAEAALSQAREVRGAFPGAAGGPWIECVARARSARADNLEAACREAVRLAPSAPEPRLFLGVALGNQGRWEEARQILREAVEQDPLELDLWSRLGVAYQKLGDAAGLEELRRRHKERFGMPLALEW